MNEKTKRYLIIGVAIFCLLVFSISAPVMGFFQRLFISNQLGSIVMPGGEMVAIEIDDSTMAQRLSNLEFAGGLNLAPFAWLSTSAAIGQRERVQAFMVLRRAAIAAGIQVSDDEVKKTIEVGKQLAISANPQLAQDDFPILGLLDPRSRVTSVAELELLIHEALRISTFVYLEVMGGIDAGDASLSEFVKKDRETLLLSYVAWAAKPLIEKYKKSPPSDKDLLAWIAKLEDASLKSPLVDDVHVAWDLVYADYKDLDPKSLGEQWVKDMAPIGDAEIEQFYDQNKATLFVKESPKTPVKDGDPKEGDQKGDPKEGAGKKEEGKPEETKKQDEHGGLFQEGQKGSETQEGEADAQKPPKPEILGPIAGPQGPEFLPLEQVKDQIRRRLEVQQVLEGIRRKAQDAYTASLNKKDEDKKDEGKKDEGKKDEGKKDEGKKDEGKKDLFSLKEWLAKQFEGGKLPKGLLFVSYPKAARPESFREGQPYGVWENSYLLRQTVGRGELGPDVQMAKNGAFFFQILDRIEDVTRPIDEIREEAQEIYAKQKALEEMKAKAESFRKLVRAKAESLLPEEVAKLRKDCQAKIDKDFAAWKKGLEDRIADTQKEIQSGDLPERSINRRKNSIKGWQAELAKADAKRAEFKKTEEDKLEVELKKILEPKMAEGFALAAKETGEKVRKQGPFAKDASSAARFSLLEDGPEKFLEADATVQEAKKGWVSDVMEDAPAQTYYVVRMDERKPGGMALVTRRAMAQRREQFSRERFDSILRNAYSPEALMARFKYKSTTHQGSGQDKQKDKP